MNKRTRELYWQRALGSYSEADAFAWALAEIADAPGTPNLATLASFSGSRSHNPFEVEDLLKRALAERGQAEPRADDVVRDFLGEMGRRICDGRVTPREGCAALAAPLRGNERAFPEMQPFRWLALALEDLESGEAFSYYSDITIETFDAAVLSEAQELVRQLCP